MGTKWYDLGTKWYGLGYEMLWDESVWVRNDLIPVCKSIITQHASSQNNISVLPPSLLRNPGIDFYSGFGNPKIQVYTFIVASGKPLKGGANIIP